METSALFQAAADFVEQSVRAGDTAYTNTETMLKLYGFYKQSLQGPVQDPQPTVFYQKARAKWNAWNDVRDLTQEEAKVKYIELVNSISPDWSGSFIEDAVKGMGPVASRLACDIDCDSATHESAESQSHRVLMELIHCDMDEQRWKAALERRGLDMNVKDGHGQTVFHWAADSGNTEAIELFIKLGMDVNVADGEHMTPLHCAAASGHRQAALQLIAHGAQLDVKDDAGDTPLDVAPSEWKQDQELLSTLHTS